MPGSTRPAGRAGAVRPPTARGSVLDWEPPVADDDPVPSGLPPFATESVRRGAFLRELPVLVVLAVVAAVVIRAVLFQAFYIPSPSMGCAPCPVHTLEINDKVLVSKLSYRLHPPRRGDIVVFACPPAAACDGSKRSGNPLLRLLQAVGERVGVIPPSTEDYIKRVVALPGETVEGQGGHVFVDGRLLREPYLPPGVVTADFPPVVVPDGTLWVMGDNRQNSSDSRVFGPIERRLVVGRTVLRIWPLHRVAFL